MTFKPTLFLLSLLILLVNTFAFAASNKKAAYHTQLSLNAPPGRAELIDNDWESFANYSTKIVNNLFNKYKKKSNKRDVSLQDIGYDFVYFGPIDIGTPSKQFDVIFDTGSADLLTMSPNCSSCLNAPRYDTSKSSTSSELGQGFSIQYGSGAALGFLVSDKVSLDGKSVSNQVFASIYEQKGIIKPGQPHSGLLGLAFQGVANSGSKPIWQEVMDRNMVHENVMGFALQRWNDKAQSNTEVHPGGIFSLGGTYRDYYQANKVNYVPLVQRNHHWIVNLDGANVGKGFVQLNRMAVIDTGTTLLGAPHADISKLLQHIEGSEPLSDPNMEGFWAFPCDNYKPISLVFAGVSYEMDKRDAIFQRINNYCIPSFFTFNSAQQFWIVGASFLKNVYSIYKYNPPSVGFAPLSEKFKQLNQ